MSFPVKITAVHNTASHGSCMTIHVFCRRMSNNIHPKCKRAAVDRSCKCIVTDHRNPMVMSQRHKFLDIQNHTCRIRNGLCKYCLGIWPKILFQLFCRKILIHQRSFNTESFQSYRQQVRSSSIYFGRTDHMISRLADIGHCQHRCRLTGRCEHSRYTALQITYFFCYHIAGGVLQSGIKIAVFFQIEQFSHLFTCFITESGTLINRKHPRFPILWFPSALYTDRIFLHNLPPFLCVVQ